MVTDTADKLLYRQLTYKLIGIFYKVHTALGCGFPEKVYQKAIEAELKQEKISYETEKPFKVFYLQKEVGSFRLDLVVDEKVIVEIKAVEYLAKIFKEQLISQLKAAPYEVGLLVNFGATKLEYTRLIRSKK